MFIGLMVWIYYAFVLRSEKQKLHTPRPSILVTYQNTKNMLATLLTYIEDKKVKKKKKKIKVHVLPSSFFVCIFFQNLEVC
jgi:hypothetical protein